MTITEIKARNTLVLFLDSPPPQKKHFEVLNPLVFHTLLNIFENKAWCLIHIPF